MSYEDVQAANAAVALRRELKKIESNKQSASPDSKKIDQKSNRRKQCHQERQVSREKSVEFTEVSAEISAGCNTNNSFNNLINLIELIYL